MENVADKIWEVKCSIDWLKSSSLALREAMECGNAQAVDYSGAVHLIYDGLDNLSNKLSVISEEFD